MWFSVGTMKEGNLKSFLAWHKEKEESGFVLTSRKNCWTTARAMWTSFEEA